MRNRKEIDQLSAHSRATKASGRHNGNGNTLPVNLHFPEPQPEQPDSREPKGWREYFPHWETLSMAGGKTIEKGFVITPGIAAVLLAAFLAVLGWAYKSSTADSRETRDSIIRMETMLDERTRTFDAQQAKLQAEIKEERDMGQVYRERQNEKMMKITLAMQANGIKLNQ